MFTIKNFIETSNIPYANIDLFLQYLEEVKTLKDVGLNLSQEEFDIASVEIANIIDTASQEIIKENLTDYSYPSKTHKLIQQASDSLCYIRLGFMVDIKKGEPRLIEVNSQTPSFNRELEHLTTHALSLMGKKRVFDYEINLRQCLKSNIYDLSKKLDIGLDKVNIGLFTCEDFEDVYEISYFKEIIEGLGIGNKIEVFTNTHFGITTDTNQRKVFNSKTGTEFDILFNWYPIEWLANEYYEDKSNIAEKLSECIEQNNIAIFNGTDSFVVQNKYLLNYIFDSGLNHRYMLPAFYTQDDCLEAGYREYVGKPIFCRQGEGIFGITESGEISGNLDDPYYNNQDYSYQPFVNSYPIITKDNKLQNVTIEKFVYYDANLKVWKAGGQGLRVDTKRVTDNSSPWLILN